MTATMLNGSSTLRLRVRDVTGTHEATLDLAPGLRVGDVAQALAARMTLPGDTDWALRDDSAAFLDDDASIGAALGHEAAPDAVAEYDLVVTPRAHFGGAR
jgi:hypothetical protein